MPWEAAAGQSFSIPAPQPGRVPPRQPHWAGTAATGCRWCWGPAGAGAPQCPAGTHLLQPSSLGLAPPAPAEGPNPPARIPGGSGGGGGGRAELASALVRCPQATVSHAHWPRTGDPCAASAPAVRGGHGAGALGSTALWAALMSQTGGLGHSHASNAPPLHPRWCGAGGSGGEMGSRADVGSAGSGSSPGMSTPHPGDCRGCSSYPSG